VSLNRLDEYKYNIKISCNIYIFYILLRLFSFNSAGESRLLEKKKTFIKAPETIISKISKKHPRLLITKPDISRIKRNIQKDKLVSSWYKEVKQRADELLKIPVSMYEIPDGLRLLPISRQVLDRIYILSLVYLIKNNNNYLNRAWKELKAAGSFKDWNPRHFLDTGEMMHAFAIGYDWLFNYWSFKQRCFLEQAILSNGFKPFLKAYKENDFWVKCDFNWNFVCNCGASIAAMAFSDIYPDICEQILQDAFKNIQYALPT